MAELWGCNRPGIFMRKKPLDTRPFLLDHFIRARAHSAESSSPICFGLKSFRVISTPSGGKIDGEMNGKFMRLGMLLTIL